MNPAVPDADTALDDAALFARCAGAPAVVVAMAEEAEPFLARARHRSARSLPVGRARLHAVVLEDRVSLVVQTGIGLVNAAAAASAVIERFEPAALISAGSAGGLHAGVEVGDVVIGTEYRYTDADATAFGYVPGQVPGMPESYGGDPALLAATEALPCGARVWRAPMLSGGAFVTAANVGATRQLFPEAVSTDMESTALAQVCASREVPFLAVRGISDLCGPAAGQQFHLEIEPVAELSANAVCRLLSTIRPSPTETRQP